jgi:hypothetical protein
MQVKHSIPQAFVWTKFGTEAGERVPHIIKRKEAERRRNGGIFLWGVGNNVGASIRLLAMHAAPEVLFSPIASAPRGCDVSPGEVVVWTEAQTLDGDRFDIPAGSLVTSRGGSGRKFHFALVCFSERELQLADSRGTICSAALRNLASGKQVGSSQVTSVVENGAQKEKGRNYPVAMRIELRAPYFVRLSNPVCVGTTSNRSQ